MTRTARRAIASPRPEQEAAEAMWGHYRIHKQQLVEGIRDARVAILQQLMAGLPVEDVFAPFVKPADEAAGSAKGATTR